MHDIELFLREIELSFGERPKFDQLVPERANGGRKFTAQRTQRTARRFTAGRIDEVGDRLGLREIELAFQEGAACELSGFREPSAIVHTRGEQHLHHNGPAMAVELENVFAGVRMRRRKGEGDAVVDRLAPWPYEARVRRLTRRRQCAKQSRGDARRCWTGEPDDADATAPRRRRHRRDRVPRYRIVSLISWHACRTIASLRARDTSLNRDYLVLEQVLKG